MTAENFLNDELKGCYQTYTEDGITLITGIEHSQMCEIMDGYKQLHIPVVVNRQGTVNLKPLEKIQERIDRLTKLKKEFEAYEDSDIIHKKELELLAERIKTLKWVVLN